MNPIVVAKFAANIVVQSVATKAARNAITTHTSKSEDDISVIVGSNVVGWYAAQAAMPYTDRFVDSVADRIAAAKATADQQS